MWDDHDMSNADQTSYERSEFEVRWNQRSFAWNMAGIFLFFLVYVAVAVLASDTFRLVQGSGHRVIIFVGSGPDFDLVAQDEVGPGVAGFGGGEVLTQLRDRDGGAPGW